MEEYYKTCEHPYADKVCTCGITFCYECCGGQNVDQGAKYESDYMYCPRCGQDWYQETEK